MTTLASNGTSDQKVQKHCVGDHVKVKYNNGEHHGVIRFIGPTHVDWKNIYYGIDLSEGCGEHDGYLPDHKKKTLF